MGFCDCARHRLCSIFSLPLPHGAVVGLQCFAGGSIMNAFVLTGSKPLQIDMNENFQYKILSEMSSQSRPSQARLELCASLSGFLIVRRQF